MSTEIGHFALIFALVATFVQVCVCSVCVADISERFAVVAVKTQLFMVGLAFAMLSISFIYSDFSVHLVWENSHSGKPLLYKFSGVWANHEGSFLLWQLILSLVTYLATRVGAGGSLRGFSLSVLAALSFITLIFIIFMANPFDRIAFPPLDGRGLNPVLQDPALAIHPPILYLGYVGLAVPYAYGVSALMLGEVTEKWLHEIRLWALHAWGFLGAGIALGAWWAYRELGWGGFWFWDPVENVALVPWLIATALLHSLSSIQKSGRGIALALLWSVLGFSAALLGLFAVRSGIVDSVHAFASDPRRGWASLAIFLGVALSGLSVFAMRIERVALFSNIEVPQYKGSSKGYGLLLNNSIIALSVFLILFGTFWPAFAGPLFGRALIIEASFYNKVLLPLVVVASASIPLFSKHKRHFILLIVLSFSVGTLAFAMQTGRSAFGPFALALGCWLICGALAEVLRPRAYWNWPKALAHGGVGVLILSIGAFHAWGLDQHVVLGQGDSISLGKYDVRLAEIENFDGPNYWGVQADLVFSSAQEQMTLQPQKRFYDISQLVTSEAAIDSGLWRDVYAVLGTAQGDGRWAITIRIKPMVSWIWFGAFLIAVSSAVGIAQSFFGMRSSGSANSVIN